MNPFTVGGSLALWWRNNQQRCIDALATGPGDQFSFCEIVHWQRENMTITNSRWRAPARYKRAFLFLLFLLILLLSLLLFLLLLLLLLLLLPYFPFVSVLDFFNSSFVAFSCLVLGGFVPEMVAISYCAMITGKYAAIVIDGKGPHQLPGGKRREKALIGEEGGGFIITSSIFIIALFRHRRITTSESSRNFKLIQIVIFPIETFRLKISQSFNLYFP